MAKIFRVVDCRETTAAPAELEVLASNAEHAARLAIGEDLIRGSNGSRNFRAKVYSGEGPNLTMVRLYAQSDTPDAQRLSPRPHRSTKGQRF